MREFTHPVRIEPWPADGVAFQLEAGPEVRRTLAGRLGLERLDQLGSGGRIEKTGDVFLLEGRLRAAFVQVCVVTLEPFVQEIDETIRLELRRDLAAGDLPVDPDEIDVVPIEGPCVDLGAIMSEELALRVDPHPRAPGASLAALEAPPQAPDAPTDDWRASLARHRQALAG